MQGDWRDFRATPEDRAGDALTVEQAVRLVACPYTGCGAALGQPCRSDKPPLDALTGPFVHPSRSTAAGAVVLARTER